MTNRRIVLGAIGVDDALTALARLLRDAGYEVVLVGGPQSPEQLVRTALAEDASELVVAGDDHELARVDAERRRLNADDITLTSAVDLIRARCDEPDAPDRSKNG